MSAKIDDGGPAYPIPEQQFTDGIMVIATEGHPGMTLRDYFAGQALTGMVTARTRIMPSDFAKDAYQIADAMLRVRKGDK